MLYVDPIGAQFLQRSQALEGSPERERLALVELEHYFLFTLLQEMRKTVADGGLFEHKNEFRLYQEMLDDALSLEMARSGQFGIADVLAAQLRAQELQGELQAQFDEMAAPVKNPAPSSDNA